MGYKGDLGRVEESYALGSNSALGKSRKNLFIILFAVGFFLILGVFFIAFSHNSTHISQRGLFKGKNFELNSNDSLSMKFDGEKHKVEVQIIGLNSMDVTVSSDSVTKRIKVNESIFFDLTNDSKNDLRVFLKSISKGKAVTEFKRVDGFYCAPEWSCDKWGDCFDGLRRRECIDLNNCGKFEESPDTKRFCSSIIDEDDTNPSNVGSKPDLNISVEEEINGSNVIYHVDEVGVYLGDGEFTCIENSGNICLDEQKCNGDWINSSDSLRCCYGSCYSPTFNLSGSNSSIVCDKSISLFRSAVYNCTPFKMNCVENVLLYDLGVVQGFESVIEIQGSSGVNCLLYYGYNNVFINYSAEKFASLMDEGKTLPQINFQLEALEKAHIETYGGKDMLCKYPKNELLSFARAWEDGKTVWNIDVLGRYECEGTLSGI